MDVSFHHESLSEFFNLLLSDISKSHNFEISNSSYAYILSLLENYGLKPPPKEEDSMLSEILLKAQQKEEHEKKRLLKLLGERTLIHTGLFGESLKRKILGLSFYKDMGSKAFLNLFVMTNNPVYEDLSLRFGNYANLLYGVGKRLSFYNSGDLIHLIDRLNELDSESAREELLSQGIPVNHIKKRVQ